MRCFAHDRDSGISTLSEIARVRGEIEANAFFGCYAYATQSGFRIFELTMGQEFWKNTDSRWLFGIDYGRSDPIALKKIAEQTNAEVRIFDGEYVVDSQGFVPRRDFHSKMAMLDNTSSNATGLVVGSGNFSYNGLWRSVEAGAVLTATTSKEKEEQTAAVRGSFESLWEQSVQLINIEKNYEERLSDLISSKDDARSQDSSKAARGFWIEAGYVTKNRGDDKPGNQIWAPRGFRRFFGLEAAASESTLIGQITFETAVGANVTKNYRGNPNAMEKLALPMPEDHGYGVYDGKVLLFEPTGNRFSLNVVELDDFEMIYGHRLTNVERMNLGRRYGEFV